MNWIIKYVFLFAIALLGIPVGMLIAKYTKEEIRKGKTELKILMIISALIFLLSTLLEFSEKLLIMTVSAFIFFLVLTSLKAKA
ncbi:MAG: hypothetical protein QW041_03095 [Candidatus Pacearchaeota archaeon]